MELGNIFEPTAYVSERLDAAVGAQDRLEAKFKTLLQLLTEKGLLTRDDLAQVADAGRPADPKEP